MNIMQEQVTEFHKAFGVPVNDTPQRISMERVHLRRELIAEEVGETLKALFCEYHNLRKDCPTGNLVEIADGLADAAYVIFGAAIEFGIDLQAVFDEVHRSNMTKLWNSKEYMDDGCALSATNTRIGLPSTAEEKIWAVKRQDGKIVKPKSYEPANISKVLENLSAKPKTIDEATPQHA